MNYTTYYNFKKPTMSEYALITIINDNMDSLDTLIHSLSIPLCKINSTRDPISTDDNTAGYSIDSIWTNALGHKIFIAEDVTTNAAIWRQIWPCDGGDAATLGGIAASGFAVAAKGVTNGDNHDHSGGDGGQIDHGGLDGLSDDDHSIYAKNETTKIRHIEIALDGGGQTISTGLKGYLRIDYPCVIKSVTLLANVSGSIVVEIWKCSYTNFNTVTHPVTSDKLNGAGTPPTISSAVKSKDSTLTNWTITIEADSILAFNVNSCTSIVKCLVDIEVWVNR